jgi:hypothetical protein
MEAMPSNPTYSRSTRLENLSLDSQGAAFALDGRPVRLNADGYGAPVASMQELYHHALADYYQRSAELSRQAAESRPPLLSRLLSWVGRCFERLVPGPRSAAIFPPLPPPANREVAAPSPRSESGLTPGRRESPLISPTPPRIIGPRAGPHPDPVAPPTITPPPPASSRRTVPPVLQVIFADQEGVHVIWQLAAGKQGPTPQGRNPTDPKAEPPKLEFTYNLESSMARRLQDCYGQLAQLGYKIAGLEAIRTSPDKTAKEKDPAKPVPATPESAFVASEKSVGEPSKPAEIRPSPRKSRAEAIPAKTEEIQPNKPESSNRDPSFLPGI